MMNTMNTKDAWNSVIFIKSDKSMSDMNALAKWEGVKDMWTTTGDWDWCVKLDNTMSSPEKTEEFVTRMRQGNWASSTKTSWWKQIDAR